MAKKNLAINLESLLHSEKKIAAKVFLMRLILTRYLGDLPTAPKHTGR